MKKIISIFAFGLVPAMFVLGSSPATAFASTRVGGLISADTVWSATSGPYLLESDVTVPDGIVLTIGPGVTIGTAPDVDQGDTEYNPTIYVSGGRLDVAGTHQERVSIVGIGGVFISGGSMDAGSASISYTDFSAGSRVFFHNARGTISSSTISGAYIGLSLKDSVVSIHGSRLEDNEIGISIAPHSIFQAGSVDDRFGTGGIGNALAIAPDLSASSSLTVSHSIFQNNTDRAIKNMAEFTVQATDVWWASPSGPATAGTNSIQGLVRYDPWLQVEPVFDVEVSDGPCCSSVLFIPGLQGSRLYREERRPRGLGVAINQLWEPNRNADVSKLHLASSGSSTDPSIYSGAPVDRALGLVDIYGRFMDLLNDLVEQGTVNEWRAFGYDWRMPIAEVVLGSEQKATTTEDLIEVVSDLARNSRTGKVSVVAHSNGGLVTKYLIKTLSDMGKADLIDSVISVAVPYLGTPTALTGLLHGDGQAILGGLIMTQANARGLAANMASAYSLLPSREFFAKVFGPTIAFASADIPGINDGSYPLSIASADEQKAFVADTAGVRRRVSASDTTMPLRGNRVLLAAADILHGILDPFVWPANIARWAIVGWNATTTTGVVYSDRGHRPTQNVYGDGTVKAQSAAYGDADGQVIPIDLTTVSSIEGRGITHANILGSSGMGSVISSIVSRPSGGTDSLYGDNPAKHNAAVIDEISMIPGVSVGDMDWNALDAAYDASRRELRISTHSPVKLHVYDSRGNHTGEIPLPPEISAQVEEGLFTMKEENVPGSTYSILGCEDEEAGDCHTMITLPDNRESYTIAVNGVGVGTFTLSIEKVRATSTVEVVEWIDVPVMPLSVATTTLDNEPDLGASRVSLASSTALLHLDIDGDGTPESVLKQGRVRDARTRIDLIKKYTSRWRNHRGHVRWKDLSPADKKPLNDLIETFRKYFGRS